MSSFKKGFTLVEVLIAVIILSTIATSLFQMSINSKSNYKKLTTKKQWENIASTMIKQNKTTSSSNLYEQLRSDYNISNFEVRNSLKKIKLKKDIKQSSKEPIIENIYVVIDKINIYDTKNSTNLFSIKISN